MTPEKNILKGTLLNKNKISPDTTTNKLKGTLLEKRDTSPVELKMGDVITVKNLSVQTPVAKSVYTGKLTVIEIAKKGSPSSLKIKGVSSRVLEDDYYTFRTQDSSGTCTASKTKVIENLRT